MSLFLRGWNSTSDRGLVAPNSARTLTLGVQKEGYRQCPPLVTLPVEGLQSHYTQISTTEVKPSWVEHLHLTHTIFILHHFASSPSWSFWHSFIISRLGNRKELLWYLHLLAIRTHTHGKVPHCPGSWIIQKSQWAYRWIQREEDKRVLTDFDKPAVGTSMFYRRQVLGSCNKLNFDFKTH